MATVSSNEDCSEGGTPRQEEDIEGRETASCSLVDDDIGSAANMETDDLDAISDIDPDSVNPAEGDVCPPTLLLPLIDEETIDTLYALKRNEPGLFISGWEQDEEGIVEKDMMDPGEQVLTAAENGDMADLTRLLTDRPDLVSVRDSDQYTPLHRAAYNNHPEAIRLLLKSGADLSAVTESGWTALHCAACWGSLEAASVLLQEAHLDVNARTEGRLTALHLAVACTEDPRAAADTTRLLLAQPGVDTTAMSAAGETASQIAHRTGKEVARLFNV